MLLVSGAQRCRAVLNGTSSEAVLRRAEGREDSCTETRLNLVRHFEHLDRFFHKEIKEDEFESGCAV